MNDTIRTIDKIMKKLIFILFALFTLCSCGCGHADGEHITNDTIKCVIIDKDNNCYYDFITGIVHDDYNIKVLNPQTGNTKTFDRYKLFKESEIGDSVLQIIHHCPHYYVEIALDK